MSGNNSQFRSKGFTLIEIVLVLALAGLLLVMVFMAMASSQKSRRDSQRRQDLGRIAAQFDAYASNHAGNFPDDADGGEVDNPASDFRQKYIANQHLNDPLDNNGAIHQYSFQDVYSSGPVDASGMTICAGATQAGTVYYKRYGKLIMLRMCMEQGAANYTNE